MSTEKKEEAPKKKLTSKDLEKKTYTAKGAAEKVMGEKLKEAPKKVAKKKVEAATCNCVQDVRIKSVVVVYSPPKWVPNFISKPLSFKDRYSVFEVKKNGKWTPFKRV